MIPGKRKILSHPINCQHPCSVHQGVDPTCQMRSEPDARCQKAACCRQITIYLQDAAGGAGPEDVFVNCASHAYSEIIVELSNMWLHRKCKFRTRTLTARLMEYVLKALAINPYRPKFAVQGMLLPCRALKGDKYHVLPAGHVSLVVVGSVW